MAKKTSMCFVCTGNTCRSPMAQFILKSKVSGDPNMDIKITSFGTNVTEEEMNPLSKTVLKNHKIKMTKFIPKQLSPDKVKGFEAIVCMTDSMMQRLISEGYNNVYSVNQLTRLGDVVDPYGKGIESYNECYLQLDKACDIIYDMLKKVL